MSRRNRIRHFEPRYGVNQIAVDEEAKALRREVDDYLLLSLNELKTKRAEHEANSRHDWQHLHQLLSVLPEREQLVAQTLFYRDVYLLLRLYLTLVQSIATHATTSQSIKQRDTKPLHFDEWLFAPKGATP